MADTHRPQSAVKKIVPTKGHVIGKDKKRLRVEFDAETGSS